MTTQSGSRVDVRIPVRETHYPIHIEAGLLGHCGEVLAHTLSKGCKLLVVTDPNVSGLYAATVKNNLKAAGFEVYTYTVPEGEGAKTLSVAEQVYAFALEIGLSRKDAMVALGGGVVGDLTGFCAATFFRGVGFVQIPTTLLAQVDSSVGGKVAVNFRTAKNGVGAFYQPLAVLADTALLNSLPERQVLAGLAEIVKYGLIEETCCGETGLFDLMFGPAATNGLAGLIPLFPEIVERCCHIKAAVVAQDETETTGVRSYLNLGHTFAHAYEEITGYGPLLHGEAVSMGMLKACQLSERLGLFPAEETKRFESLSRNLGLPLEPPPGLEPIRLLALMRHDKKSSAGKIRLILPVERIGRVEIRDDVPEEILLSVLE